MIEPESHRNLPWLHQTSTVACNNKIWSKKYTLKSLMHCTEADERKCNTFSLVYYSQNKHSTSNGSLTELSLTPSIESDDNTLQNSLVQDTTLNEIDFLERLRDEDTPATDIAKRNCYRGYIASAVDLHEGDRNIQSIAHPMRAISEEHIPLCVRNSRTLEDDTVLRCRNNNNKVVDGEGDSLASGTGSQEEGSPMRGSRNESFFSRDSKS